MGGSVQQFDYQSSETEEFAQRFRELSWRQERTQIDAGPSRGQLQLVQTPHILLVRERHTKGLLASSYLPQSAIGFGLLRHGERPQRFCGRTLSDAHLATATTDEGVHLLTEGPWRFDYFTVDRAWLNGVAQATFGFGVESLPIANVLATSPRVASLLRTTFLDVMSELEHGGQSGASVEEAEERLAVTFLGAIADVLMRAPRSAMELESKSWVVDQARDFIEAHLGETLRMADICERVNVSVRYLQLAFREQVSVSPGEYIRRRRLHAARRLFLSQAGTPSTVAKVAVQVNWGHLGRFSEQYRRLFGEQPSQTIAAAAR